MDKRLVIIIVQVIIIFAFIAIITLFLRLNNAYRLEKRISKYSIRHNKSGELSLFDKVFHEYLLFVKSQRKKIKKLFPTLTKIYDKYSVGSQYKAEDYITHKLFISWVLC